MEYTKNGAENNNTKFRFLCERSCARTEPVCMVADTSLDIILQLDPIVRDLPAHRFVQSGTFKDYDILHDDIRVQILDDSAEFLESEDGEEFYLDYSRKVLGQETKYKRVKER